MFSFIQELDSTLQMFWYIALPASVIFLIQLILTFIGLDATDGADVDFEGDLGEGGGPFQLLSFRNLINFLLGFGWGGISLSNTIENRSTLTFVAVMIGLSFFVMFFLIMRQLYKLQEDNTVRKEDAINLIGTVYMNIPESKSGMGKIQVSVRGSQKEYQAMTNGESISSGTAIRIVEMIDSNVFLVEKL